ncbi:MAG: tRNA-dihydrouridine synthase [Planctomycetota bacterium]
MTLALGPIMLDAPLMQAGLAGYSDRAMRSVARRRGCPYAVTEALLDITLLAGGKGLTNSIDIDDEDHPVAGQIMGSEPAQVAAASAILANHGYDVIDLNFACPVKKVKNKARGGWMLKDLPRGFGILRAVRDALPNYPLSVSLRRGFDDTPESAECFFKLCDEAWQLGFVAVRVHGRTVEQKYAGRSKRPFLAEAKAAYPDQIIWGSGDVFTAQDAVDMLRETNVDGVWIARGAIGNPWIFRDTIKLLADEPITPPTVAEQRDALAEHFDIAMAIHGEQLAGRRMRKMGIKYSRFHPDHSFVKQRFINIRSLRDWQAVLDEHYTDDRPGVWPASEAVDEVNACAPTAAR